MSKPRLCEILGVEVNERFRFEDFGNMEFEVSPFGYIHYFYDGVLNRTADINYLCEMVRRPERIIHKSKWTQQDISDARSLIRLFDLPKNAEIYRDDITNLPTVRFKEETGDITTFLHMAEECFPHLKDDVMVSLEEILNAEAEDDE